MTAIDEKRRADDRNRVPTKPEIAAAQLVQVTRARLGRPIPEWINRVAQGLTPLPPASASADGSSLTASHEQPT